MELNTLFDTKKFFLEVTMPQQVEYAEAVLKGGADCIKVRCNPNKDTESISGQIGSFEEEKPFFKELIQLAKDVPVGLLPGLRDFFLTEDECDEAKRMGFKYFVTSARFAPPYLFDSKLPVMIAAAYEDSDDQLLRGINLCPYVNSIELNIIARELMGTPLVYEDILRYYAVVKSTSKPVIGTAQRVMRPQDVKCFYELGCKGLMIGGTIFNDENGECTPEICYRVTSEFREAIDKL